MILNLHILTELNQLLNTNTQVQEKARNNRKMGDMETLTKARNELEEMYLGVPDDSVDLTFQYLAQAKKHNKPWSSSSPTISKTPSKKSKEYPSNLTKVPSLDFNRGLQATFQNTNNHVQNSQDQHEMNSHNIHLYWPDQGGSLSPRVHVYNHSHHHHQGALHGGDNNHALRHVDERSVVYDDMSHAIGTRINYGQQKGGTRRRPVVPHSNICTLCSDYIYIFRHRCLVCGRVYCRKCVRMGMGEMTEGRKCVECLGRRFSSRYIQKAGKVGCCMGYPSKVKQQELKWAEKGPRRSGENRYSGSSVMVSRSKSQLSRPTTPRGSQSPNNPPFVMSSTYSPTGHHHMPF